MSFGQIETLVIFILVVFISSCISSPDDANILPIADQYSVRIAEGWTAYELRHYQDAIVAFNKASDLDPLRPDSYLGLGWSCAMVDQIENSLYNLDLAVAKGPDIPDGYAARAFVYLAKNNYGSAVLDADSAISMGGEDYVFSQIPEVNTVNLHLLMAECYYAIGKYSDSQMQINILKPNNKLDPNSSNYKQDLLLEIEALKSVGSILGNLSS